MHVSRLCWTRSEQRPNSACSSCLAAIPLPPSWSVWQSPDPSPKLSCLSVIEHDVRKLHLTSIQLSAKLQSGEFQSPGALPQHASFRFIPFERNTNNGYIT